MYIMHKYDCCDTCLAKSPKLNMLADKVSTGIKDHFEDFNLEYIIIYIKKVKMQLAIDAKKAKDS